ncbi:hypothetical protein [Chitinophaga rhizophila]|uniref:Uncharacterized protein n=1 Tax=Chitinophaga rhizophila TaxID=2866212 RepID=A0ABS7GGI7_9BACT|nr:hypothetical protein [Chitinophaga rhizophila]MBW8686526.1 hypothetical protein [Chitinophaga rhizophila]
MKGSVSQVLIHITSCVIFPALPIVFSPGANATTHGYDLTHTIYISA